MSETFQECACMTGRIAPGYGAVTVLESIRKTCAALSLVYLPEATWAQFKTWHGAPDFVARHRSMLLLALERGHLGRLTSSVHRYLLEGGAVHPGLRRQYLTDLRERWMHYAESLERHQKWRIFNGRIAELQCAEWLDDRKWAILGLEAWQPGPDIEAKNDLSDTTAFEVKAIGAEDGDFSAIVSGIAADSAPSSVSAYSSLNYLLFRVYEAAKQLEKYNGRRTAVIVIDDLTWWRFEFQLQAGWIDWRSPRFFRHDADWAEFEKSQAARYPLLNEEFRAVVGGLDELWILRRSFGYQYHLEYELRLG